MIDRGLTFTQIDRFCKTMGLRNMGKSIFYEYQAKYIIPTVRDLFESSITITRQQIKAAGKNNYGCVQQDMHNIKMHVIMKRKCIELW